MSLRTRLTVIVAVIVAVAVVGGAYAAHVSTQHALREETDKFLRDRAAEFVRQPPRDLGGDFGGAPNDPDDGQRRYFQFDAIQQTIDGDGTVTNSLPNQPTLPIDAEDRELASSGRRVALPRRHRRRRALPHDHGAVAQRRRGADRARGVGDPRRARRAPHAARDHRPRRHRARRAGGVVGDAARHASDRAAHRHRRARRRDPGPRPRPSR